MRILLVDDNPTNLTFLTKLVEKLDCVALAYAAPNDVLDELPSLDYDVAVIDYQMPALNGIELLNEIMRFEKYRGKPAVFVTADNDQMVRMAALEAGAIDFLTKPINPLEFLARVRNLLSLVIAQNKLADTAEWLRAEVDKAVAALRSREEEIIDRLTLAASYKDSETAKHTRRVADYSEAIAREYGLPPEYCADIRLAAPMQKGSLTKQEYAEMQKHTLVGCEILRESQSSLMQLAAEIAGNHHERWDGKGYPRQLSAQEIPLSARIVALADNFDALTTVRPYKEAWPVERAVAHIIAGAGSQFDPACVQAFQMALPEITNIMLDHADDAGAKALLHSHDANSMRTA